MCKRLFNIIFLLSLSYICTAQPPQGGMPPRDFAKVEALKTAFITNELNLTVDEAQRFWPVYNAYLKELKDTRKEKMNDELAFEEAALAIKKKYRPEFKKILNDEARVNKLFSLEHKFRDALRKEMERRMQMRNQRMNGGNGRMQPPPAGGF